MPKRFIIECSENDYLNFESLACQDRGREAAISGMSQEAAAAEISRREALTGPALLRLAVEAGKTHAIRMGEQFITDSAETQKEGLRQLATQVAEQALATATVAIEDVPS